MNFDPEHDPDFERHKFRKLNKLEDMPEEYLQLWDELNGCLKVLIADQRDKHDLDQDDAIIRYMAFHELQLHNLQEEVKHIYRAFSKFGEAIDNKQDKPDWN